MHKIAELLAKDEPLNPALRPYIIEGTPLGQMINHPLIQEIAYRKELNAFINERYRHKLAALDQAIRERAWMSVICLHERPYRLNALLGHAGHMNHVEYWEAVGYAWTDSENIWQNYEHWRSLWECPRPSKHSCMGDDEQTGLAKLPQVMTVYRGIHAKGISKRGKRKGLSWTLDREKARWFASRWKQEPQKILEGTVKKSHVHAHFLGRGELEIVATEVHVK